MAIAVINRGHRREALAFVAANVMLFAAVGLGLRAAGTLLLFLVLVPLFAVLVRRPQRGILALVALVPFNGLLEIVPHPAPLNGWKEALVLWVLLCTFICPAEARRQGPAPVVPWLPALIALIAVAVIAGVALGDPVRAAVGLKITFFYVLAAWAVLRCPFDESERDRLVTILMVTGVIVAVIGIGQQVVGPDRLHALGYGYNTTIRFAGGFFRSFSTFVQPFGFGFYVMAVLLICIPVALDDLGRRRNVLFLWLTPLLAIGMATSVVRGAVLGTGVGIAYLGIARHRVLLLAFPLALVGLLLLPANVSSAALSTSSSHERTVGWTENLKVLSSHPLGVGPGTSAAAAERLATSSEKTYQPDNYYYHVTYEEGVLGLWFFCLLLASGFATARWRSRTGAPGRARGLERGASAFFVAAAVASLVASFLEIFPMDVLMWVLMAVAAVRPVDAVSAGGPRGDIGALAS